MSYSSSGGGTLTLPSPKHGHHVDVTSAVRTLRRSLSRSPSKFRFVTNSPSPSPKSPLSPSLLSPLEPRPISTPTIFAAGNQPHTPSPLVPFPPSAKLALRSAARAKSTTPRPTSRTRTSPKSPMKRALSQTSDSGNAPPSSSQGTGAGQENSRSSSPKELTSFERAPRMSLNSDAPINHALSRLGGDGTNESPAPSTSSPLKRSDAIMNLDQANLGSPVAKRRSVHGSATFGSDFNVFDHGPPAASQFEIHDDSNHEYELTSGTMNSENNNSLTSMPRRSSSLRKSTLQQRHGEKTSWGRRIAANALAAQHAANASPNTSNALVPEVSTPDRSKNRPRLSMDQFVPPMPRDSPFNNQERLPNASMHMLNQPSQPSHQPHPLSRTMTTSSSSSSLVEDSPTHPPVHFGEQPRPKLDFSKSLPAGTLRPFAFQKREPSEESFNTPQNYKSVKPLPAAFASTGLISKVNRNPEASPVVRGTHKPVPDTPCKKQMNHFATYPAPIPGSAIAKARHVRHSFGTPSTPFNPHGNQPVPGTFGRGAGVFGSTYGGIGLSRRGSFLSVDGDDEASPNGKGESQSSNDYDLPPTPTKQTLALQQDNGSPSNHRSFPASAVGQGLIRRLPRTSSKLNLFMGPDLDGEDNDGSFEMNDSPTVAHVRASQKSTVTAQSLSTGRTQRTLTMRSPLAAKSHTSAVLTPSTKPGFAKFSHVAPASPLERIDFIERLSPRTPQDGMLPPDPSGLSISNPKDVSKSHRRSMPPPATPTTGREYFMNPVNRRLSTTPIGNFASVEVDESLTSRFTRIELVGTGEFSQVYRVTQPGIAKSNTLTFGTPPSPPSERVFAVKKSRQPYQGIRDRQRKLQEVEVLKALGHSDHVVRLDDSWEEKSYLYIQTEFCEEGSLDLFLSQVGRKGRLDDFRIWKIMLEISLGLKHIHDSKFIHLDLKPANILITFEGVLKIADFGMASAWPAPPGIEGEGDREYIGPEILLGKFDKPADIFALGLIMFEIAGNVQLPDNGPTWQRLRSGDISDVPSLSFSEASSVQRDANGFPVEDSDVNMMLSDDENETGFGSPTTHNRKRSSAKSTRSTSHDPGNLFGTARKGELHKGPVFMKDADHPSSLDQLVRWMISPDPQHRPTIQQLLQTYGVMWIESRRRAGATVFERNWGPADDVLDADSEMLDI